MPLLTFTACGDGQDPVYEDPFIDLVPVKMDFRYEDFKHMSDIEISEYFGMNGFALDHTYFFDEEGYAILGSDIAKNGAKAALNSLVKRDPTALINWGVDSLYNWMFGREDDADVIQKTLDQINSKLDEIAK